MGFPTVRASLAVSRPLGHAESMTTITFITGANKGLGYETARRLTELGAPTRDGQPWCYGSVYTILRNPKYTGKVVLGRTRNAGGSQRPGERRVVRVPRDNV